MGSNNQNADTTNKIFFSAIILITMLFLSYAIFQDQKEVPKSENSLINRFLDTAKGIFGKEDSEIGEIDDKAAFDVREPLDDNVAGVQTGGSTKVWVATDYSVGDIQKATYIVKQGDTLWEIAEAVYGNGSEWHKLLDANKENVGYLPNGSQALIKTGQTLFIP